MKTKILRNIFISVGVLFALTGLLAAGTRDGEGLVRAGNALPANIIVVTNTNDSGPGSLRNALAIANDDDTIDATSVSGTILLTSDELQISHSVTINGPGAGTLAINGNGTFHVFEIFDADVTISGFTITNGLGGITNENGTTTTVSNCSISGNLGGGISNVSGGLCCATLTVTNSTISGNTVAGDGGAIFNSTSDQHATLMITNSTISGNSATGNGGGIYNGGGAELELGSTILNAGGSGENIFNSGTATSLGYNLCSDNGGGYLTGPGDLINTDPMLGPLQNNGGPTFTHALLPSSPAINAGDPNFTPPPFYDQRGPGFDRVVNGRIDIGSFEVQAGATPTPTATATPTPTPTPTLTPTPTPRPSPTPRPRPTPHPRPTP